VNRSFPDINYFVAVGVALLVLWLIFAFTGMARADIDMSIIAKIESSGNPNAVSFRGEKYGRGLYQISEAVLKEYNSFNRTDIKPDELFNPETCYKVAYWYLHKRIPQMLRYYQKPVTLNNILISYNAGILYTIKEKIPTQTNQYIKKYKSLKG
jgi:soluble lytic murein transglycosylase-like protein